MMDLVYLIEGMFNSAGMERVVANKANYFSQRGYNVIVITTDQGGKPYYYKLNDNVTCLDLDVNFRNYAHYFILFRVLIYYYKTFLFKKRLSKFLYEKKVGVVISLMLRSSDFLHKIKDGSVKIIEHHFSYDYASFFSKAQRRGFFLRFVYSFRGKMVENQLRKYDRFVVLTEEDAVLWRSHLQNVEVIPNSVTFHTNQLASVGNKIVLAVGRLEFQKGFDRLLEVWRLIHQRNSDWKLHIYGDGQDKKALMSIVEQNNMSESITFFPPTKDIQQVLLSGSVYAMTSRFEGFPMILIEAMSCGLPVVSFACKCGPSDIISDSEDGFLIEDGNVSDFAEKLSELMQNPQLILQMGALAKHNMERFSEQEVMGKWEKLFSQLTKGKK